MCIEGVVYIRFGFVSARTAKNKTKIYQESEKMTEEKIYEQIRELSVGVTT